MVEREEILVIDDDEDFCEALQFGLEQLGYAVQVAYTADDGMEKLRAKVPDLLILDIMMQRGAEGIVLARKIHREKRFAKLPVLMLTGMREQTGFSFIKDDPRDPHFLPVTRYLEKPVELEQVVKEIQDLLKKRS